VSNGEKRKSISPRTRFEVLKRDGFACTYCGRKAGGTLALVIDHVAPFSKGGPDDISNYATACNDCNAGKGAVEVVESEPGVAASGEATLVGKFFHECRGDSLAVLHQGMVVADHGFALEVLHFDWIMGGDAYWTLLVSKDQVVSGHWLWYSTDEQMRDAWEYGGLKYATERSFEERHPQ
jgi:hypothetical protein